MKKNIECVLFDLDGTLLDTAPDLVYALNLIRLERSLPEIPVSLIRSIANLGSKAMLRAGLDIDDAHPELPMLREQFLAHYHQNIANNTRYFPHVDKVLQYLDNKYIPWGIVTNKPGKLTDHLLKTLRIAHRPRCVVSGDTLSRAKPHPDTILHACRTLQINPASCLYVGDAATDITASKAAGTRSLVALYGYINSKDDPFSWKADGYVHEPMEIIDWLEETG